MKVEELEMYGKALEMPKDAQKKQIKIVFNQLKNEFGYKSIGILFGVLKHAKRIKKEYPEAIARAKEISPVIESELVMMGALFSSIADRKGRKYAGDFMTRMMEKTAAVSMPALYQLPDLLKCEGDIFDNFKKMNRALFTETNRMGTWKHDGFHETEDLLEFKVTSCANIELFEAIECSELNTLGCDHDCAGYPLIEEAVQCEFRRTCTLAKGGDCCYFKFYRKGMAIEPAEMNV